MAGEDARRLLGMVELGEHDDQFGGRLGAEEALPRLLLNVGLGQWCQRPLQVAAQVPAHRPEVPSERGSVKEAP